MQIYIFFVYRVVYEPPYIRSYINILLLISICIKRVCINGNVYDILTYTQLVYAWILIDLEYSEF